MGFMLLAEDLLLLLTDDDTGKLAVSSTEVDVALGGALLVELTLMHRVDVAEPDERVHEGRLVVRDRDPTGDRLLDEALTIVGQKEGRKPQSVVTRLGKRARVRLYERLVEGGVLRAEDDRILGIFPTHRWPSNDATHESSVRAGLVTALREGATTDARTGALVSLLLALHAVHKAVDPGSVGLSKKELHANAKRIAEGDWAAKAVRQAIDSMNAAIIAATSSAVVVGGGSGSS
jgi:Golgi phosphoprotein 3 (GPP34)